MSGSNIANQDQEIAESRRRFEKWITGNEYRGGMTYDGPLILFCDNGDGTVNCAWCDERFNADLAVPDVECEPICQECAAHATDDGYYDFQNDERRIKSERDA